jgi:large subunit ribosomal protein L18
MRELRRIKTRRQRRKWRLRKSVKGTAERPRLTVFRSDRHIYCQIIDDTTGNTLETASTLSPEIRESARACSWNKKGAEQVGELIAKRALAKGITRVCFDRNGCRYHGRVKAVADSAGKDGCRSQAP